MKKYTLEDLKTFEPDEDGYFIYPSGDYSDIKEFDEGCVFDDCCIFGDYSSFGKGCYFGMKCKFGRCCIFGLSCRFGSRCDFGEECHFGAESIFFVDCNFDRDCSFGECCYFSNYCKFENLDEPVEKFIKIDRIGSSRCAYFFKTTSGKIYVRCESFFGGIDEFALKVIDTYYDNEQSLKEYIGAIKYIRAVM